LQEPDDASQHLLAGQAAHAQVVVGALADDRQDGGEVHQMVVLVSVADLAPAFVVDVLLPAAVVPPGGLNVAGGVWADPDIGPGRRDGQLLDPRAHLAVADRLAVRVAVAEATPSSPASDARALVGDVAQARGLRGLGSVRWRELAQRRVLLDACSDDWYTGRRSLPARAQIVYMPPGGRRARFRFTSRGYALGHMRAISPRHAPRLAPIGEPAPPCRDRTPGRRGSAPGARARLPPRRRPGRRQRPARR